MDDKERLVRIDERTMTLERLLDAFIKDTDKKYVTKDEFTPVKQIVYGVVGLILTSVVAAIITIVLRV